MLPVLGYSPTANGTADEQDQKPLCSGRCHVLPVTFGHSGSLYIYDA